MATKLSDTCMLVVLKITAWTATKKDRKASADAADASAADRSRVTASKRLVAQGSLDRISKAASAARAWVYDNTRPWMDEGPRILKNTNYFPFLQGLQPLVDAYNDACDEFAAQYPQHVRDAMVSLGSLADPSQFPDVSEIRAKFSIGLQVLPFPDPNDFRVAGLTYEATDAIKAGLQEATDQVIQETRKDIAAKIIEACTRVVDRMQKYDGGREGSFKDTLIENLRDMAGILPQLNIGDDPAIDQFRDIIESLASVDPDDLRKSKKLRAQTEEDAGAIIDKMKAFL
jgi:hypothetical protein